MHGDDTSISLAKVPYRVLFFFFSELVANLKERKTTVIDHVFDTYQSNERFA